MLGLETLVAVMAKKGLLVVAPIAVLEGPIVTVIAAWLASRGILQLPSLFAVVVIADLIGDSLFYTLGRWGLGRVPPRWRDRFGLHQDRLAGLAHHFDQKGGRTLAFGKLTHSAGAAVLVAAGLARMPFGQFIWYNLLATLPKSALFVALGYTLGAAYSRIDSYIASGSLIMLGLLFAAGISLFFFRQRS